MSLYRFTLLPSDIVFFISLAVIIFFIMRSLKKRLVREAYLQLIRKPLAFGALSVLLLYGMVGVLDSIHFQKRINNNYTDSTHYDTNAVSLLDRMLPEVMTQMEKTYSFPLATHQFVKETSITKEQFYPRLRLINPNIKNTSDVMRLIYKNMLYSSIAAICIAFFLVCIYTLFSKQSYQTYLVLFVFFFILSTLILLTCFMAKYLHVLGTGRVGQDILYYALKSIRTGIFIGVVTIMVIIPFAVILGISSGLFGGVIDDVIQYIYITVSSIPGVLLIAASVLSMQIFISTHPNLFTSLSSRADARLIILCIILGLTHWTGLCRMIRAETLKLREMDYIQSARVLGSSESYIIFRHILPNVMHLLVISLVIDFSFLVLAEAVLSYIGVGVSALTISFGNMINGARLELAREPMVWWPMLSAFVFMFGLVLSANIFGDALRDVFDPRAKRF